jgi:peroxiredoxin
MSSRRQNVLPKPGSFAPGFHLMRLEGSEVTLAELIAGGPVMLVFYKITCPVCQMTMPFLERMHRKGSLRVYGISQNEPADTREFLQEYGVSFPNLLDAEDDGFPASNAYGISSVPTIFVVDRDGTLSKVIEGWNKAEMTALGDLAGMTLFRTDDSVPAWKAG